ncbi:UDP-Glycosyltransferase superfamily protein [Hibiscus syriacus]|uniref:UDP-Glycosyltransferase superfamily protein n=1 Tax=Hibiscus syriacus TaxID=106335 RepID=A0A6A3D1M9_HIBSY|nr:flavonol 7-O-rhamnosyltransferase-like [Hibiscus syriacus]KAE8735643.1 UDP-Glycosyltransferase superfamily protein [Hibiscus syriacus]
MTSYCNGVHILMIPYPGAGHILPLMDLTHQLLRRGLTVTVMVTPKNLHYLNPLLSLHSSSNLQTLVLPFPSHSSIPHGIENMQDLDISFVHDFAAALSKLHDPIVNWFESHVSPPVAIVSDMLLSSWTPSLASNLGIPNVCFVFTNAHAVCSWWVDHLNSMSDCYRKLHLGCIQSWGLVFNSFDEIDDEKINFIKEEITKHNRLWAVGPLLPIERGPSFLGQDDQVIQWLDSCHKVDKSVVYVGFGTQITFSKLQMEAVASALEQSAVRFIWVVKEPMKGVGNIDDDGNVVPPGFEDRVAGRGVVIKGWAPQVAILGHPAVGSYLSHCSWNSALEGFLAEVLLLAWPMQADHFRNAALLVDELGVAVRVCEGLETVPDATKLARTLSDSLDMNKPERVQAMKLRKIALDSIGEGGSSYRALDDFVEQLSYLGVRKTREM